MKTTLTLILATLGFTASLASAHGKPHAPAKVPADILAKYDANKDGKLDAAEMAKWKADREAAEGVKRAAFIAKYDKNGDGVLNAAERAAAAAAIKAEKAAELLAAQTARFKALDTDGVAGLSDKEWAASYPAGASAARIAAAFKAKDTDKNGTISFAEFIAPPFRHGHGKK
jgi:Ca2+-binding EF-hand superfamily protein